MVDVVLQGVRVLYCINEDEGHEALLLLGFRRDVVNAIFLKNSEAHYPQTMQQFEISQNITRFNLSTDVLRFKVFTDFKDLKSLPIPQKHSILHV